MSESIEVSVYKRDSEYWIIPHSTYRGFALNRHSFERQAVPVVAHLFDHAFAKLNAVKCTSIEARYVLKKLYNNHNLPVSLVLKED